MKKTLIILIAAVMLISFAACGGSSSSGSAQKDDPFEPYYGTWKCTELQSPTGKYPDFALEETYNTFAKDYITIEWTEEGVYFIVQHSKDDIVTVEVTVDMENGVMQSQTTNDTISFEMDDEGRMLIVLKGAEDMLFVMEKTEAQ
ncbi:MAG: hypothetical protein IIZ17_03430 [Eubacteriaceae bacterium]|nr:hypothetical protein [Eubacteriaceae bacterium]